MKLRVNAPVEQAMLLLERFGALSGQIALAQAARDEQIAAANAVADRAMQPLIDEAAAIQLQLEPWWARNGAALLTGKRKTIELGGCKIGSKAGKSSLTFTDGNFDAALAELKYCRWAKPYIRTTEAVDKVATAAGLEGKHAAGLKEIGFSMTPASETFVLEPVKQQGGTIAG
ncbi:MAG TPA: host-nuclease inhibitor Gam family protein [Sphingomonas sp.]|jgi:hypothetical protein